MGMQNIDLESLAGYEAGKRWIVEGASETERANLAATFAGGLSGIFAMTGTYPSLAPLLRPQVASLSDLVDFGSSPWLVGFRNAVVEEFAEPG